MAINFKFNKKLPTITVLNNIPNSIYDVWIQQHIIIPNYFNEERRSYILELMDYVGDDVIDTETIVRAIEDDEIEKAESLYATPLTHKPKS